MISLTGEHALRAMVVLARRGENQAVSAKQLAEEAGIPPKYLSTILGTLARYGLLEGTRGRGGGFQLSRPARDIRLAEIVESFEPVSARRNRCPFGNTTCSDADPCAAHDRWKQAKLVFANFLQDTTLLDVATKEKSEPGATGKSKKRT